SVIPIRKDAPLDVVCLVSCGVLAGAGPGFNPPKGPAGGGGAGFGGGGVGPQTLQAARVGGAGKINPPHTPPRQPPGGGAFGATHRVDAGRGDPVARIHAIAGGGGVDFAFEVVGLQKTMEQAVHATHRGGMAVMVGVCPAGTRLSIDPTLLLQQRTLTGTS